MLFFEFPKNPQKYQKNPPEIFLRYFIESFILGVSKKKFMCSKTICSKFAHFGMKTVNF